MIYVSACSATPLSVEAAIVAAFAQAAERLSLPSAPVNVPTPNGKKIERLEAVRKCALDGLTKREAATEIGVTWQAVHNMSKKYGVVFQDRRAGNRPPRRVRPKGAITWEQCAASGKSAREAAAIMGVQIAAARSYAQRHGLKFRPEESRRGIPDYLVALTEQERADYTLLKNYGSKIEDALVAVGRHDLALEVAYRRRKTCAA